MNEEELPRKGQGMSWSSMYLAVAYAKEIAKEEGKQWQDYFDIEIVYTQEDLDKILDEAKQLEYNPRFFWNRGEIPLSKIKVTPTQSELDHVNKVIAKIDRKFRCRKK
jgi:hypothetical protein